jgi:hypothetical protein
MKSVRPALKSVRPAFALSGLPLAGVPNRLSVVAAVDQAQAAARHPRQLDDSLLTCWACLAMRTVWLP